MIQNTPLIPGMIDSPQRHRLLLRVEQDVALDVLIYSPAIQGSLIYRRIPLDNATAPGSVRQLEQAIYDNPLLVQGEFESVHCNLVDTRILLLPPALSTAQADCARKESMQLPEEMQWIGEFHDVLPGATLHYAARQETVNFLQRTFFGIGLRPVVEPLARFFSAAAQRGNERKIYVNFRHGHIDVIALSRSETLLLNSFACDNADNAAYYILAATELGGFNRNTDAIMLAGDNDIRELTTNILRRFARRVMPVIFPSAIFTAGRDAMLAPFDLCALALETMSLK